MMSPEEYKQAKGSFVRFGDRFDAGVEDHLPPEVVRTKKGAISKRQPRWEPRSKAYYQAQCSFRGLETTGERGRIAVAF